MSRLTRIVSTSSHVEVGRHGTNTGLDSNARDHLILIKKGPPRESTRRTSYHRTSE